MSTTQRTRRLAREAFAAAFAGCLLVTGSYTSAQGLGVVAQQSVPELPDLRIVTLGDAQRTQCYTLFIIERTATPEPDSASQAADDAAAQSARRLREAAEKRDRDLAAIRPPTVRDGIVESPDAVRYEAERRKVDATYEAVLRAEIPASTPWASLTPGMPSGGWENQATVMRRAMIDADSTSAMKTTETQFAMLADLLRQAIAAPRLAVSGPAPCASR